MGWFLLEEHFYFKANRKPLGDFKQGRTFSGLYFTIAKLAVNHRNLL